MTKETTEAIANARADASPDYLQRAIRELADALGACSNDKCPACGGKGPEGEWSEGDEVKCVDCGADLMVDTIQTCHGSSSFSVVEDASDE